MLRDRTVFDIEAFVPSEVVHRDGALDALSAAIEPVLDDGDAAVIETYINTGAFDRARQAYRERVDAEIVPAAEGNSDPGNPEA